MTIAEGIAAAKLAMDAGSKALDLLRNPKIDGEAVRSRITEMQDLVFSAQRALGEAEEENRRLKYQLDDREALKALEADMDISQDSGTYFRKSEKERGLCNPCCPVCWGDSKKAIPLQPMSTGSYRCVIHEAMYFTQEYKDEQQREAQKALVRKRRFVR